MTGIVLAGGESSRFGRPKWRARIGGQTLLDRAIATLQGWCDEVLVVVRPDSDVPAVDAVSAARVVEDLPLGRGPLVGIASGLRASRTAANVAIGCDMPFADATLLQHLVRRLRGYDAAVPVANGRLQPLHAAYHRRCAGPMEQALAGGVASPTDFLARPAERVRYVIEDEWRSLGGDDHAFFGANTPEELSRARALARRRSIHAGPTSRPRARKIRPNG